MAISAFLYLFQPSLQQHISSWYSKLPTSEQSRIDSLFSSIARPIPATVSRSLASATTSTASTADAALSAFARDHPSEFSIARLYAGRSFALPALYYAGIFLRDFPALKQEFTSVFSSLETHLSNATIPKSLYKESFAMSITDNSAEAQKHRRKAFDKQPQPAQSLQQTNTNALSQKSASSGTNENSLSNSGHDNSSGNHDHNGSSGSSFKSKNGRNQEDRKSEESLGMRSTNASAYAWHEGTARAIEANFDARRAQTQNRRTKQPGPVANGGVVLAGVSSSTRSFFGKPPRNAGATHDNSYAQDAFMSAATGRVLNNTQLPRTGATGKLPHKGSADQAKEMSIPVEVSCSSSAKLTYRDPKGGIERPEMLKKWVAEAEANPALLTGGRAVIGGGNEGPLSTARATMGPPPLSFPAKGKPFKPIRNSQPYATQDTGFIDGCASINQLDFVPQKTSF
eukprot:ANDGO_06899.mRNA.1 hypothetical protein